MRSQSQSATEASPPTPGDAPADARGAFLRVMSHELRTPLNAIIGFSEILSGELYGPLGAPQYKEYAEIVRLSGRRLLSLVNQALDIIRLEDGDHGLSVQRQDVVPFIDDAIDACADDARRRGVELAFHPQGPVQAACDARGLTSCMAHLIQNAICYGPENAKIFISIEHRPGEVEITVRDDGPGLDPDSVSRLMRPFERGGDALVASARGAGLGWTVVDLTTRAMGGRFEVDTAPGQGLTARLVLKAG
ncbi:HAMP domain-containing sensor histidine kinase [Brevundimonas sp. 2R-24]|uniref:histidine kinase n=1 Tax=Peiella sedimenti TaxID=3061083 RepID=A0ABT8SL20_9CAUL|nr:HAMP domain-containing sensor histidine kinase [Caulobacteraceae bacterium XZ-24]